MSLIPQTPVDPVAVMGSLRVGIANNVHAGERLIDVTLDTVSDLTHHYAVFANAGLLSVIELQQSLLAAQNCGEAWTSLSDHGHRCHENFFKFVAECFSCRHRALDRLYAEDGYGNS
jgi:hypothetical protein